MGVGTWVRFTIEYHLPPSLSSNLNATHPLSALLLHACFSPVAKLIMSGQISARIDSQSKTLHVKQTEKRAATYRKVLGMGEVYLSEMQVS